MMRWTRAAALLFVFVPLSAQAPALGDRQVDWQRSLADALAVAQATGKPLLLAVNMDGESASDRIVHERYVDPAFVALTRRCVCLGASVFRHNARDHDDAGRRIPCPRFGGMTCGEHMALEPQLWERYLADGERVAPRHALVLADGSKAFDVSLSFDLRDIDRALAAAVAARSDRELPAVGPGWALLAARRDANGRAALEAGLLAADEPALTAALAAIGEHGDAGSLAALRLVAARVPTLTAPTVAVLAATARQLGLGAELATVLTRHAQALGDAPADAAATPAQRAWVRALAPLAIAGGSATRSFRLAHAAIGALEIAADFETGVAPRVDLAAALRVAQAVTAEPGLTPPARPDDALPDEETVMARLHELEARTPRPVADAEWHAAFARASLDLARRHMATGARDTQLLLEDASRHFDRALALEPACYEWWLDRARAAFLLERFAEQIAAGERAYALATGSATRPVEAELAASVVLRLARAAEALRWIGDGHARLLATRSGGDARDELAGMVDGLRALAIVAVGPFGRDRDWLTLASFAGAIGLWRQEQAILQCGAMRHPASRDLRQALNASLWNGGRPDLSGPVAERIVRATAPSADADWFAGYAWLLVAEDARRRERPADALEPYATAQRWFASAAARNADYRDSCDWFRAVALLGSGHAQAQAGDRAAAADALLAAVAVRADLSQARDGLGYDVLDLVDRIVEWREHGGPPLAPTALLDRLDELAPDDPFWAAAVSDAALREALRADGRNPERVVGATVDAGGRPITMPVGLPTEAGDEFLRASIEAGRRAFARARSDADREPLAQSAVIAAERERDRGHADAFRRAVAAAAVVLGEQGAGDGADEAALRALVAEWRQRLGPARPRLREGR